MTDIPASLVKQLREMSGAGMMECKRALQEADGDLDKAFEILRTKGRASAAKRAGRSANQGVIDSYIHFNNTVGVLVELNCETDFVANTPDFKQLARDVALHVASAGPVYVSRDDVPEDLVESERKIAEAQARELGRPEKVLPQIVDGLLEKFYDQTVLLDQSFVKDETKSIRQLLDEVAAKVGEKVAVRRFVRYKLGEEAVANGR
jgi:elongation factor Ts